MTGPRSALCVLALALAGCAHPSASSPAGAPAPFEQQVDGLEAELRDRLQRVSAAPTERATIARVLEYCSSVLKKDERRGLTQHRLLAEALRRNPHIRDATRVESYFFNVTDVFPDDCSHQAHAAVDARITAMVQVARCCDRPKLVSGLEARRQFVRNTRARMDAQRICLGLADNGR